MIPRTKRGVSFDLTMWIIRLILIALALYFISMIISSGTKSLLTTHDLEYALLLERPLYSSHGFSYTDSDTTRTYPNVVDPSKFTEVTLERLFQGGKPFALRYTLEDKMIYYNQSRFVIIAPLLWSEKYSSFERNKTVLIRTEEGTRVPKTLVMTVVFEKKA